MEQPRQDNEDQGLVADVPKAEERRVESVPAWGPVQRAVFRFLFSYLVLYNVPFLLEVIPVYGEVLQQSYVETWKVVPPWVGEHVFGIKVPYRTSGGGDKTYTYVLIFCYLILALAATAVWTLLDSRRANYARLHQWLRIYVRFALAAAMLLYGAYKVIPEQFGAALPSTLLEPIGDSSPMGLLWTFMGASIPRSEEHTSELQSLRHLV